jgi:hypothetical protein
MKRGPVLVLLLVALAAGSLRAGEADVGDPPPEIRTALASGLVLKGRSVSVEQRFRDGKFDGIFHVRIRASKVLKGILGPVMAVEVPISRSARETYKALLEAPADPDAPECLFCLDEIERFHLPPLFRIVAPPLPVDREPDIDKAVLEEIREAVASLSSEDKAARDAAVRALVALGSPAVDSIRAFQKKTGSTGSEESRAAINSIRNRLVDPLRIHQPNRKYPEESIPVYFCPRCRDILFRLAPGTLVYRLNTWDNGKRVVYRIRTSDGREGWILAGACVRASVQGK